MGLHQAVCWFALVAVTTATTLSPSSRPSFIITPPPPEYYDRHRMCGEYDKCSCDESRNVGKLANCSTQNCFCDASCVKNEDCCYDYKSSGPGYVDPLKRPWIDAVVSCAFNNRINTEKSVFVINRCPQHSRYNEIGTNCRLGNNFEMFGQKMDIPVYGKRSKFLYSNIYCSLCNEDYDIRFMKVKWICPPPRPRNTTEHNATLDMTQEHRRLLGSSSTANRCQISEYVLPNWKSSECEEAKERRHNIMDMCPDSSSIDAVLCANYTSMVSSRDGTVYKNWHCAKCDGKTADLSCGIPEPQKPYPRPQHQVPIIPPEDNGQVRYRPISLLFSVNGKGKSSSIVEVESKGSKVQTQRKSVKCPNGRLSLGNICYAINCGKSKIFKNGKCVSTNTKLRIPPLLNVQLNSSPNTTFETFVDLPLNCHLISLKENDYTLYKNNSLFIHNEDFVLNETYYRNISVNGTHVLQACVPTQYFSENITHQFNKTFPIFRITFDETQALVSLIGQIISIVSLAILIIIYLVFKALRNIPGMCLMSLALALFLAQLLFVTGIAQTEHWHLCYAIGVAIHYFFLASFFWMSVIAYDLCRVFACVKGSSQPTTLKTFVCYSLYGWLLPLLIIASAILIDINSTSLDTGDFIIVPSYANGLCFITNRDAVLVFFVIPAGVLTVANFILFCITVWGIHKAMKTARLFQEAQRKQCKLLLYMKLATIMGLTWIFGFIQSFTDTIWSTYIFIVLNSLQGLFICLAFVCTKKVAKLLRAKFSRKKAYPSTTKTTSISSDREKPMNGPKDGAHTKFAMMQLETSL